MTARVILKPGKEKPVLNAHPWVFSGAVARTEGRPADGDVVDVTDNQGAFLARGLYNRRSQIVVRLFAWTPGEDLDLDGLRRRIAQAMAWRGRILPPDTDAYRVVFSEADGLPGLIVDRYGATLAMQTSTLGMEQRKDLVMAALRAELTPTSIVERPDSQMLEREGRPRQAEAQASAPSQEVAIRERGFRFLVDLRQGQKTGFYIDQRDNRQRVAAYCGGGRVLDCFAYTGGFAVYAAAAGAAQIINVDTSAEALALAERNIALNGFDRPQDEYLVGDVFQVLRDYRTRGELFDVVILDPPKFAHSAGQVERAARGYKDINRLALQLLRPNGILATFSCSGLITPDLFQKIVFSASVDARRPAQIVERLSQGPDHPVLLSFPESEYLKGLICRAW